MRNWLRRSRMAAALGMLIALGVTPLMAQSPASSAKPYDPPRLPNGHPDFQGLWYHFIAPGFDPLLIGILNGNAFGPVGGGGAGGRGAPPAGGNPFGGPSVAGFIRPGVPELPYLPEAAARQQDLRKNHPYDDPEAHCHLPGVPRDTEQPPYPIQFIQDDKYMTFLYEYVHDVRIVPMDHGKHPANYSAWDGDSRGYWDGDTFVVDVSNFNGETWLDMDGNFVDKNEQVVERYTLVDKDTMAYEATITDPTVFSKPWTMRLILKRTDPKEQVLEYGCVEGERDTHHYTQSVGGHQQDGGQPSQPNNGGKK